MSKHWIVLGAISGFFGVVFGAFGGHVLKERLTEKAFSIYQIGIQYHLVHALALIGLGIWGLLAPHTDTQWAGLGFTLGVVLFSGSLYALALTDLKFLGMVTPLGGISFLVGWIAFAFSVYRS